MLVSSICFCEGIFIFCDCHVSQVCLPLPISACFNLTVIQAQTHLKNSGFSYFPSPHFMIMMSFFTPYCLSFCCSWCLFSLLQISDFFFFQICILAYLSDYFPVLISSILYLLTSFQRRPFTISFKMCLLLLYSFTFFFLIVVVFGKILYFSYFNR